VRDLRSFGPESAEWAEVLQLDLQEMQYPWTESMWRELNFKNNRLFIIQDGQQVVGFALYQLSPLENLAHLLKIVVHPVQRGTGCAPKFFAEQVAKLRSEQCTRIYLEVSAKNETAVGFYRKLGFSLLRRIPGFYQDGAEAFTMEMGINSSI